jgi:hypothetical protein
MISIIILLEDPYPDFAEYISKLDKMFSSSGKSYETLVIANGTGEFLRSQLDLLTKANQKTQVFEFGARTTQAICLKAILKRSIGDQFFICGGYQQLTDTSMLGLLDSLDENTDVISPWRKKRVDPVFNQLQSKVFNWLVRRLIPTSLHDFNCTVKVVSRPVLEETELYGNMFRFLPILASGKGFRVKEQPVEHYQERGKIGIYNLSDYFSRLFDIFTLFFNTSFSRKPLRFFSGVGFIFLISGFLGLLISFVQRFLFDVPIGNRPVLFLSLLMSIVGVLIASAGLLGEIIAFTNGRHKKEYTIEKII